MTTDLEHTRAKYARRAYDRRYLDACRDARKANPGQPLTDDQLAAIKLQLQADTSQAQHLTADPDWTAAS